MLLNHKLHYLSDKVDLVLMGFHAILYTRIPWYYGLLDETWFIEKFVGYQLYTHRVVVKIEQVLGSCYICI